MTRTRILVIGASLAVARAMRNAAARGLVELAPVPTPRRAKEPELYRATADTHEPPNDVRRLRREQYARERRTRPVLAKGKGRR